MMTQLSNSQEELTNKFVMLSNKKIKNMEWVKTMSIWLVLCCCLGDPFHSQKTYFVYLLVV